MKISMVLCCVMITKLSHTVHLKNHSLLYSFEAYCYSQDGIYLWLPNHVRRGAVLTIFQVHVPKTENTYCKKCNKHTEHKVTQYKAGKASLRPQGVFCVSQFTDRKATIRYETKGLWRSDEAYFPQEGNQVISFCFVG